MSYLLHKIKFFNINKNTLDFPFIWNDIIVFNKIYGRNFIMYKIGEFAKLCNCTTKLIRFYDDIGLLKADYVDAGSGYRYYNTNQKEIFQKIILFREVGFTLKEITQELLFSSEEAIFTALEKKEKELKTKYELCCKLKENYKELENMEERINFIRSNFIRSKENDSIILNDGLLELFTDEQNIQPVIDILDGLCNVPGYINIDLADLIDMAKFNDAYSINLTQIKISGGYDNIPLSENLAKCGVISIIAFPSITIDDIDTSIKNIYNSMFKNESTVILGVAFNNELVSNEIEASVIELY